MSISEDGDKASGTPKPDGNGELTPETLLKFQTSMLKDFVSSPKPNGYQSIHTNVRLPDGRVAEVQVRSAAMHARAEHGMAAHGLYKGGLTEPAQLAALAEVSNRLKTRALPASGATPTSESTSAVPVGLGQSDVLGSADSDVVAP